MIRKILGLLLFISGSCGLGAQGLFYELEQLSNPDILPQAENKLKLIPWN